MYKGLLVYKHFKVLMCYKPSGKDDVNATLLCRSRISLVLDAEPTGFAWMAHGCSMMATWRLVDRTSGCYMVPGCFLETGNILCGLVNFCPSQINARVVVLCCGNVNTGDPDDSALNLSAF
jgi:hypothetical protein